MPQIKIFLYDIIKLLETPFVVRECSSERNLLTAWDLDSPIDLVEGSRGKGTTNLPSREQE
jgi:hypothetical protein